MAATKTMERTGTGMPGMPMTGMPMSGPAAGGGHTGAGLARDEHDDGASLHDDLREVPRRHEGQLLLRGQGLGRHAAEPLHDDGRRHAQLLLHDEWDDGLLLQHDDGALQVRADGGRRLHHLHQR